MLFCLGAGCLGGFASGLLGIGGGVILNPILIAFLSTRDVSHEVIAQVSFGTNLFAITFTAAAGAYQHNLKGNVIWRPAFWLALASIFSAQIGAAVASHLKSDLLIKLFAVFVVFSGIRMFSSSLRKTEEGELKYDPVYFMLIGLAAGLISAIFGVGGGVISIPLMVFFLNFPVKKVAGTSNAAMVVTTFAGTLGYVWHGWGNKLVPPPSLGYVSWAMAVPIAIGGIIFARIGAWVNSKTDVTWLKRIFGIFLIIVAVKLFLA